MKHAHFARNIGGQMTQLLMKNRCLSLQFPRRSQTLKLMNELFRWMFYGEQCQLLVQQEAVEFTLVKQLEKRLVEHRHVFKNMTKHALLLHAP